MSLGEALGDLAVTLRELEGRAPPAGEGGHQARFRAWFAFGQGLFQQAVATLALVERAGRAPTEEERAALREAVLAGANLRALGEAAYHAFAYLGFEDGFRYGGAGWGELSLWRSAFVFLREMVPDAPADLGWTEDMDAWASELREPVAVPEGMPERHGWWFRDAP